MPLAQLHQDGPTFLLLLPLLPLILDQQADSTHPQLHRIFTVAWIVHCCEPGNVGHTGHVLSDWEGVSLFCLCDVTLMSLEVTGLLFLLHRSPDAPGELLRLHRPRFSCLCNRLTIPGLSRLRLMIAHRRLGEPGVSLSSVPVADAVPDSSYSDTGLVCRCFREKGLFKHISKPVIKSQQSRNIRWL